MRLHLLGLLAVATACHPTRSLELPEAPMGTQSALLAIDPPKGGLVVTAFVWPADRPSVASIPKDANVTMLFYEQSLGALGIDPGRVANQVGLDMVRPLPTPSQTFTADLDDQGLIQTWKSIAELPGDLRDFRIPSSGAALCAQSGGCFLDDEARELNACTTPCPTPSVPAEPTPPNPPMPPVLTPCPNGWLPVELDEITVCAPPERTCVGDQLIDQTGCQGVSSTCAADGWPTMLPMDRPVRFVDSSVAVAGNGSQGAPFRTIVEALTGAPATLVIALKRGTYTPPTLELLGDVELAGACASETIVELASGPVRPTGNATQARVRDVTIRGGAPAFSVSSGTSLSLTDTRIESAGNGAQPAIAIDGGALTLERSVFASPIGAAIHAVGGTIVGNNVLIRDGMSIGLDLEMSAQATISDTVIERMGDHAVRAATMSTVNLARVFFRDATDDTVSAVNASVDIDRSVFQDGHDVNGLNGRALHGAGGASVTVNRSWFARMYSSGVRIDAATLEMTDTVIRATRPRPRDNDHGMSLALAGQSDTTLTRVDFRDSHRRGINMVGMSRLTGTDIHVGRVLKGTRVAVASGIDIADASSCVVERVRIEGASTWGLRIDDDNTCQSEGRTGRLSFTDLTIVGTDEFETHTGIDALCGPVASLDRVRIDNMTQYGVNVNATAVITALDVDISNIGLVGIDAYDDARFEGTRVALHEVAYGLSADFRGVIRLRDALIDCTEGDTPDGIGVRHKNFGVVELDAFEIRHCDPAFWIRFGDAVDLDDGYVHDNGTALETDFDLAIFMRRVVYENNATLTAPYDATR